IPHAKGYCPAPSAAIDSAPAVPNALAANKAPEPVSCPTASAPVANASDSQPPLHPFQPPLHPFPGIPNHYILPNTCNFAASDKCQDGDVPPNTCNFAALDKH
ncbi:hypothetical protein C0989_007443, partial [Termitomyces sp. Mn162]